jgi:hypothetical protein
MGCLNNFRLPQILAAVAPACYDKMTEKYKLRSQSGALLRKKDCTNM